MWVTGNYHRDAILCHVLEHLVQNGVDHVVVRLSHHKAHGGRIQICGEFIRGKYWLLCNIDGSDIVAKPQRHRCQWR